MSDFIYLCSECGNCFPSETSLQEHDLAAHSSLKHVCLVCHKEFNNSELLKRHVTAHENLLHCCNICGELCENKIDVYVHVTTSHKYEGKMVCDLCSKTFSTNSCLKFHSINKHAEEMPHVLQKWELFCNVHSSHNLCKEDVLKNSFHPFGCPLHPKVKKSGSETDSLRSDASKLNQSVLLSKTIDDPRKPLNSDSSGSSTIELQTFLQEHGDQKTWYTKDTDHLSNSILPNDILERAQSSIKNKNGPHKDQSIKCHLCNTTFNNKNDYLLAHGGQDPSNVYPHKQEDKSVSLTGLQNLIQLCKSTIRNTSQIPSQKCMKEFSSIKTDLLIHQDRNASAENQNQLKPNDTLLAEISSLMLQIQNKNPSSEGLKDHFDPNDTSLPDISALTTENPNQNTNAEN